MNVRIHFLMLAAATAAVLASAAQPEFDCRGRQFIGFDSFGDFVETAGPNQGQKVLVSPEISTRIDSTELVVSWNVTLSRTACMVIEARAIYPDRATRYYSLGTWSVDSSAHPRQSASGQNDGDGTVATDTLVLQRPTHRFQLRLTFTGNSSVSNALKFLGLSVADTHAAPPPLPPLREAWGREIPVPERTQMIYPDGKTLCSPTTVSMLMGYWAQHLNRPELDRPVPEIAAAIYDSNWQGTGNWPFNMAYAGSFPGIRAYVSRLSDLSELEAWIAEGIPVGLSVDYDRLRAKGLGPNGHLVVLAGFTAQGDPIINDPGTTQHVRKIFPRKNLIEAWSCSRNTVYLIYPMECTPPPDRFGHWYKPGAHNLGPLHH